MSRNKRIKGEAGVTFSVEEDEESEDSQPRNVRRFARFRAGQPEEAVYAYGSSKLVSVCALSAKGLHEYLWQCNTMKLR